jgi:hypothetical protein
MGNRTFIPRFEMVSPQSLEANLCAKWLNCLQPHQKVFTVMMRSRSNPPNAMYALPMDEANILEN